MKILELIDTLITSGIESKYSNVEKISDTEIQSNCTHIIKHLYKKIGVDIIGMRASDIFEEIDKNPKLQRVFDIKPGDLVLWRKEVIPNKGDSGHLCICTKNISKDDHNIVIQVFDSVKELHSNDQREYSGIGLGEIKILLSENKPSGFIWGGKSKKTKFTEVKILRII